MDRVPRAISLASVSMGHTLAAQGLAKRDAKNPKIDGKTSLHRVFAIKRRFRISPELVTPVDLSPSCDTRTEGRCAIASSSRDEVLLIEKRWSWADKRHFPPENIEQLRQLIDARAAEKSTPRDQMRGRSRKQMGGELRCACVHGPELIHREDFVVAPDAPRSVKNRTGRAQAHERRREKPQRQRDECQRERKDNVERSFHAARPPKASRYNCR